MQYQELREKYHNFHYYGSEIEETDQKIVITYNFEIEGLSKFSPQHIISKPKPQNLCNYLVIKQLIFNLGLVELISYWKLCACKNVYLHQGNLDSKQINWWKKLYYHGLGEYFYLNDIHLTMDDFMNINCLGNEIKGEEFNQSYQGNLIPVGGGKDSFVSLSLLQDSFKDNYAFVLNKVKSALNASEAAGYKDKTIMMQRTLDHRMIELNKQGYLNGHTPFSALVAFASVLNAVIYGKKYVVLSNEASANESTVLNEKINHQYSKSYEFEEDFNWYLSTYIQDNVQYFSLLRPLSEYQITEIFASLTNYHQVFRSCNVGSKQGVWCNHCAKCLFVYIMLSAFLSDQELINIFHDNLYQNKDLEPLLMELCGLSKNKPFECVGTREEVNLAIKQAIDKRRNNLPYLLKQYLNKTEVIETEPFELHNYFNEINYVPKHYQDIIIKRLRTVKRINFLNSFKQKKIIIWGFGREGKSTYELLKDYAKEIIVVDQNKINDLKVACFTNFEQINVADYDLVFKSPGIVYQNEFPLNMLTSQTAQFIKAFKQQTIAITGSKGKSTTSSLLYEILKNKYPKTYLVGNIGVPCFDIVLDLTDDALVVFEISCHQLEYIADSAKVAVLLNTYQEHLDHYQTYAKYVLAKENVFKYQTKNDWLIINDQCFKDQKINSKIMIASLDKIADIYVKQDELHVNGKIIDVKQTNLIGHHNLYNAAIAYYIAHDIYGVPKVDILKTIKEFKPLAHRLEKIAQVRGITFVDDSISTINESTINAIKSLKNVNTVLIGGMDRKIDYQELADFLHQVKIPHIIFMYASGKRIYEQYNFKDCAYLVEDLQEAVALAMKVTQVNSICLLSPAAASYGYFKNFEQRGEVFKQLVKSYEV